MNIINKTSYRFLLSFLWLFISFTGIIRAEDSYQDHPLLIISSYNPETRQTSTNISAFLEEYKLLGGKASVIIENMNCKSFSDAILWKAQMKQILGKYTGSQKPSLIILLGQEAWTSYVSQDNSEIHNIPVICGMVSRNVVLLPDKEILLDSWQPESSDAFEIAKDFHIVAGYAYDYDVVKNIELIKDFYPDTKHIAFVSDNSYGGVSMQAHVRKEMKKFPELDLILLDGRQNSIYTVLTEIADLPEKTVILIGTWRVDRFDGYFINATYTMKEANPKIPVFTLASLGMGHWAIGGYLPVYRTVGKDMAHQAINCLQNIDRQSLKIEMIPNHYVFDIKKLQEKGFGKKKLPENSELVNQTLSFYEQYRYQIIGTVVAFCTLLIGLLIAIYYYLRTKKLKDSLEASEVNLIKAKEKAEESNRLKTAFLANMSHEIRTPLNAIVGFANVLTMGENTPEDQKNYYQIIQTNSDLLLHLINDILDISRLESGRVKFSFEKCDVVSVCKMALSTAEYAKKSDIKYIFHSSWKSFELTTDLQRLQQILINLLSNAGKFTKEGSITLDFHIDEKNEVAVFSVSDTGCGIPVEKAELVFERFEKLNEYAQGTGLGLAICKLTIEKLGGRIWVDTVYKEGAKFVFTHPLQVDTTLGEED